MNIKYIKKMTTSKEIMEEMPLSNKIKEIKKNRDAEIRKVFENESDKFLLIVGPCSADKDRKSVV